MLIVSKKKINRKLRKNDHRILDTIVYLASLVGPIFTIPQIYTIFNSKSADNISIVTWIGYLIVALIWTWYGVVKKDGPIIFNNALWVVAEVLVIVGGLLYR